MKRIILTCIALTLFFACANKKSVCVLGEFPEDYKGNPVPSHVFIDKNIQFTNTTSAKIIGKIYRMTIHVEEKFQQKDILPFANIVLTNTETKEVTGTIADLDGAYNLSVPAATYQLTISFVDHNTVVINNIDLKTGEILNLSAQLGSWIDKEYFTMLNHRSTKELIRNPD